MKSTVKHGNLIPMGLCFLLFAIGGCSDNTSQLVAITNVTVIDAVNGERSDQTVVYENDRIVEVGESPTNKRIGQEIDGTGKFLIPGLWDMHVHLTFEPRLSNAMPRMFLNAGVTSVRDTGGLLKNVLPVIEKMRQPGAIAPRVFFSGPLMDGEHVVYDGQSNPKIGIQNSDVDSALANLAHLHEAGVDFVKIYEMVTPEVFAAISNAAAERDLPVAAHVPLSMTATTAAPMADSFEHFRNIELDCAVNADELLQSRLQILQNEEQVPGATLRGSLHSLQRNAAISNLDKKRCEQVATELRGVIQVPTAALNTISIWPTWERNDWPAAVRTLPLELQTQWQSAPPWFEPDATKRDTTSSEFTLLLIDKLQQAGVSIGAGTDTPIARAIPGYSLHTELEILVKGGLSPLQALRSATIVPAEFFKLDDEMGSIAAGMRADMVLLDANPLADIRNTRSINTVIYRGKRLPQN